MSSVENTRYGPNSEEYVYRGSRSYVWRELKNICVGDVIEWNHDVTVTSVFKNRDGTWFVRFEDHEISTGLIDKVSGRLKVRVS